MAQSPVMHLVAVAQFGEGELVSLFLGQQANQGHVADLVEADEDGVVEDAVGQAALHVGSAAGRAGTSHHMEVGQSIAIFTNEHARTASVPSRGENGNDRGADLRDGGDPFGLGLENQRRNLGDRPGASQRQRRRQGSQNKSAAVHGFFLVY